MFCAIYLTFNLEATDGLLRILSQYRHQLINRTATNSIQLFQMDLN